MSLEFIDGFDHATNAESQKWDITSNYGGGQNTGRFTGGVSYSCNTQNAPKILTSSQLTAVATRTVGFAFQTALLSNSGTNPFFQFLDSGSTQLDLRLNLNGTLFVTRAGTVLGTTTNAINGNLWVYIEFQATINSATGSFTLKVWNGMNPGIWLSMSGINTQATANPSMNGLALPNAGYTTIFDDFYCLNSLGSVNNGFLGESRIITVMPSADDASYKQWTPSAGTNHYANVNEWTNGPDADTTYNSSGTVGQIDLFTFSPLSINGAVNAVQTVFSARKDNTGTRSITEECRSGGNNYQGANSLALNTTYLMLRQIRETDPATGAAWTQSGINAAEFGVNLSA